MDEKCIKTLRQRQVPRDRERLVFIIQSGGKMDKCAGMNRVSKKLHLKAITIILGW